jgi:structure-specific endonuclease subunit SLX1
MYICYCLKLNIENANKTYVGCTNNFRRRIRQHNSEIKGGAKLTTRESKNGFFWTPIYFARGFLTKSEALSFEWHWKYLSRKQKGTSLEKRYSALLQLLNLPRFSHIYKEIDEN